MKEKLKAFFRQAGICLVTAVVFFIVTMPFRNIFTALEYTEVRPAAALNPVFSLVFGVSGALGCTIGNFVADLVTGYGLKVSFFSIFIQFSFSIIPHLCWKIARKELRLNSARNVGFYLAVVTADSFFVAILISAYLQFLGFGKILSQSTLLMAFNNIVFGIGFGIPILLIFIRYNLSKVFMKFSLTELFILVYLGFAILAGILIGTFGFTSLKNYAHDMVELWNSVYLYITLVFVVYSLLGLVVISRVEKLVTKPIEKLVGIGNAYIHTDASRDFESDKIINACMQFADLPGEVGYISKSICEMSQNIKTYISNLSAITAEKERIGAELNVATNIQASMLPKNFPAFPEQDHFVLYASMSPAREVGGDFYDFYFVDDSHLAMVIADVSGKGVPSALFMVIAKTIIKNIALHGYSPSQILEKANVQLCEGNDQEMFVSVWIGILDVRTGHMVCSNAGHEYPAICRKGGDYELFKDKHCFVLGGMECAKYKEYDLDLGAGDRIFLYTDGVPEATNGNNELLGNDRMLDILNSTRNEEMAEFLPAVRKGVDGFVGDAPQFDDLTMMALTYRG